jgi:hypothetical protein
VSKAFSISKNTAAVDILLLKFRVTWSVSLFEGTVVLPPQQLLLCVAVASIAGRMGSFSFLQTAVAAVGGGIFFLSLRAPLMQVAASAPHTTQWLPTVGPDVAERLAVVALRDVILGLVIFHPDCNVAQPVQLKDGLRFLIAH